jgi:TetR/AcrR family transcriptional repressor of nem operon
MLRHYAATVNAYKRRMLLSAEPEANPRNRLITFFESSIAAFMASGGKCPCLLIKLSSEVADFSDAMRQVLVECYQESTGIMEAVIREGVEKKMLRCDQDPLIAALLLGDLWTGAVQRASVVRSAEPLRTTLEFMTKGLLLSPH